MVLDRSMKAGQRNHRVEKRIVKVTKNVVSEVPKVKKATVIQKSKKLVTNLIASTSTLKATTINKKMKESVARPVVVKQRPSTLKKIGAMELARFQLKKSQKSSVEVLKVKKIVTGNLKAEVMRKLVELKTSASVRKGSLKQKEVGTKVGTKVGAKTTKSIEKKSAIQSKSKVLATKPKKETSTVLTATALKKLNQQNKTNAAEIKIKKQKITPPTSKTATKISKKRPLTNAELSKLEKLKKLKAALPKKPRIKKPKEWDCKGSDWSGNSDDEGNYS